ncbi:5-(carboxyamino)imidazole ribonucleotide synthase [Bacillus thuringiensis serovar roskildiensis]|uniref:N5-carboxyaminoimidazole ribonucleotide synthase n=1 Tax=Bacillus thuringiensis serovar sooncheon TaxID=180891 RepID=A0A9Q5SM28_BACTU|nr:MULTISPECIES: 5-(carboxyamino)imidazole ribonucleotide synthase [Bacillus]MDC7976437.1 5-(carboxyamino)imidazole ribonucleotide synthase [Bacillus sp. BLCC-B18]OTW70149.1 5-(carboxyamino)imidazole ribonucleotide synthase [Bacillus thuringiensis serovar coreanensis]OTX48019.1 5-(carboxyamino)imidazole ribonucleotide synthase [Bacillus thuringiensis serovar sooncheon]OTX55009.1 5-(carboxyamino)imidazole ribonucleotide synthase [Bacillus thuringiensis serovar guiyangiensis]OTX69064.1 5-(carbox
MTRIILPGKTIGIIGGGQLGRMMALAAKEMGYKIAVLDPTKNSPCAQVADIEIVASYDDLKAIQHLAEISDVITYEFENIDYRCLQWLEKHAYLPQGSQLLSKTQNRFTEKNAIEKAGLPVATYRLVQNEEQLTEAITELSYPSVLKTTTGGYDGKGQVVLRSEADVDKARELAKAAECILEKWVPFEKEVSVIVTRSVSGETKVFPVAENIHVNNILHESIVPARITEELSQKAIAYARVLADELELVGTLAVEMFATADDEIYINELAPRPHNSGHYTQDACETSQFGQHIRAICNLPLGETNLLKPVVMVNILGEHIEGVLRQVNRLTGCYLHLYGKEEAKAQRKMGHVNILNDNIEVALEKAKSLHIWDHQEQLLEGKR